MASTSAAEPSSAMKESPNWLEMPDELMVNIFQRLPTVEVLKSVRKVCTTWGRICKDPAIWKVIKMLSRPDDGKDWDHGLEALTKEAVDLSCGGLIDISIEYFGTDELLDHIVLHTDKLKRLWLESCYDITGSGLILAVKRLPQLEELHLCDIIIFPEDLEVVIQNCPQLKYFEMFQMLVSVVYNYHVLAIAENMPELRHLGLSDSEITNDGLMAILNGCPHLQSLDVRWCRHLWLDGNLGKLCMERIKDFKSNLQLRLE